MTWSIGLHFGESVVEFVGRKAEDNDAQIVKSRAFMPQTAPDLAFSQFVAANNIEKVSHLKIVSALPLKIIEAEHGAPAAVLTTSGFENWMELSLPIKTPHFSSMPERQSFLIDREYIFGISERTNAQGHIEKILDESELEFLVAKLAMHEIKTVAVCFLHSDKNSENEKRAKAYLEKHGLKVFLSSGSAKSTNENHRFWAAALNAYVNPYFIEKMTALNEEIKKVASDDAQILWGQYKFSDVVEGLVTPLEAAFSFTNFVNENFAKTTPVLYCGLEDFIFFKPGENTCETWASPVGQVSATHSPYIKLQNQPLTKLDRGFFSELALTKDKITYDPGPVVFGRGHTLSLFDLLTYENSDVESLTGIAEKMNDRGRSRCKETLSAYARNLSEGDNISYEELTQSICENAAFSWRNEMGDDDSFILCGPLAPIVKKYFNKKPTGDSFFILNSLLQGDLK
ncbi:MAG: hypothetical protein KDD38_02075 [Bdellovibrionales bacterium]|nr:hypothetical protein [Bdellovibrionales bacterium]